MRNYQLYARVLRLWTDCPTLCKLQHVQSGQPANATENIVREVIATDAALIWC